jgi:hypothetical protein
MVVEHHARIAKLTAWKRAWSKPTPATPTATAPYHPRADGRQERSCRARFVVAESRLCGTDCGERLLWARDGGGRNRDRAYPAGFGPAPSGRWPHV